MPEKAFGYSSSGATLPSGERIVRAAKHLFAIHGYGCASTMAIAREAATSETQLLKKFGTKEGLLEAIFDDDWQALSQKLTRVNDSDIAPMEKLKRLVRTVVEHLDEDADLKKLIAIELGHVRRKAGHQVIITRGYLESCAMVEALFAELRRRGKVRKDLHAETLRSCLFGMMAQFWWEQMFSPKKSAYSSKQILLALDTFLASIAPPQRERAKASGASARG